MEDWTYALMGAVAGAAAGVGVGYAMWGRTPAATNNPAGAIRGRSNTSASYALPNKNAKIGFGALATPQRQDTQVSPWLWGSTNAPFNQQSSIVNPEGDARVGSQVTPGGPFGTLVSSVRSGRTIQSFVPNPKGGPNEAAYVLANVPSCINIYQNPDGTKVEVEEPCR